MGRYAKSLLAVVIAGVIFLQGTIADGISKSDWAGLGAALVTALGIYVVPNVRDAGILSYAKGGVAVAGAVFSGLVLALTNGNLSDVEIFSIIIAAAGAIGVVVVPNRPAGDPALVAVGTSEDSFEVPADPPPFATFARDDEDPRRGSRPGIPD